MFRPCALILCAGLGVELAHAQVAAFRPGTDTIPFLLSDHNNILVPVVINNADTLRLMFHSSFTGVSVTRDGQKHCTTLLADGEGVAHSWGGDAKSAVSRKNTLRIGRLIWDSVQVSIDEQSGQGSDGKFGWDLFADRVLEINYDRLVFVVHTPIAVWPADLIEVPFTERDGSLYTIAWVSGKKGDRMDHFMLHTGYGGTCILGTDYMRQAGEGFTLDTVGAKTLSDAYGNTLTNITARAKALIFARQVFPDLPIQVMDQRSQFADSVLGNDLLRRFNTFIDFPRHTLYLKANSAMSASFSEP